MRYAFLFLLVISYQTMTIFDFNSESNIQNWRIVDDVVMGGRSNGNFKINTDGHGEFSGYVSLENNGGFSSVRYNFETINSSGYTSFKIRLKGDGKPFQFRVKSTSSQRYSYIYEFQTSGEWETISIPFNQMSPSFRGYQLNQPNFNGKQMGEIAFLIGNKKEQAFKLLIDKIELK
ncbi:CIA30 family protein [Winogradskyella jejuensis]|uniref:Complex I intermediate-associated protein 30 (CIA30) n=1 Tax=Winogradskyella jejuensis TaxID=1089305 RepID=A0A1M5JS04_9FLAO|nr:CIA30 family protein [Winogradskyella jejuensis]SHG43298.1 Complex I intermediate-associated protein 30 (CIA30) [Winogradskyella jejuensis]